MTRAIRLDEVAYHDLRATRVKAVDMGKHWTFSVTLNREPMRVPASRHDNIKPQEQHCARAQPSVHRGSATEAHSKDNTQQSTLKGERGTFVCRAKR